MHTIPIEINGRALADYLQMQIETGNDLYTCILVALDEKERQHMPVSFSEIVSDTAQVSLRWGENDINLVYHPGRVTEETFQLSFQFGQMDNNTFEATFKSFNEELASVISSWDVYEDEEKTRMYPLDAKHLAKLPIMFRVSVLQAVLGDIRPEAMAPQR